MGKLEEIHKRLGANIDESMGGDPGAVPGVPAAGPKAPPARLQGIRRKGDVAAIPVEKITRDPAQPREEFDPEGIERLARSLKTRGQLQPARVRWDEGQGTYVLICGERRWRAAQMAGMPTLDCVIIEGPLTPAELLAVQLVENALREDLTPLEAARAYKQLMEAQGWSVRQLAAELAVAHPTILRALSLLELPESVQHQVEQGELAPSVAAELTKLPEAVAQAAVAQAAVEQKMTRQEVAEFVQARRAQRPAPTPKPDPVTFDLGSVLVRVTWKKADGPDLIKALKQVLKLAQERARDDQAA
jgi:ParB family transcriptional regulator, chromosome partitioning protein